MRYFKNIELVRLYSVSDKAVRNWIEGTQRGKFKLDLIEDKGRTYIADSLRNQQVLETLAEKGRKFKNRRALKDVSPSSDFYQLFNFREQINIFQSLDKYREIPQHFRYFGEGGHYWNSYLNKLSKSKKGNMLTASMDLLKSSHTYLNLLLAPFKYVQVVDIGVGNGLAAYELLKSLQKTGKLTGYVGVDCSQVLLDITERNVADWFAGSIPVRKVLRDITNERFGDLLFDSPFANDPSNTASILLFQGGTIGNFRDPSQALQTIRESMGSNDILITTDKLDSENARRFFDFNTETDINVLSQRNKMLLRLLSIEDSFYDVEQLFDERYYARHIQVRLKFDITINFQAKKFKTSLHLRKGETILIFRMWEWSENELISLYEECGFSQLQMAKSSNEEYILLISKTKNGPTHHPIKFSF